eukprot:SAG11_NODE_668_length_7841_cov_10.134461_7_plen_326_part_00
MRREERRAVRHPHLHRHRSSCATLAPSLRLALTPVDADKEFVPRAPTSVTARHGATLTAATESAGGSGAQEEDAARATSVVLLLVEAARHFKAQCHGRAPSANARRQRLVQQPHLQHGGGRAAHGVRHGRPSFLEDELPQRGVIVPRGDEAVGERLQGALRPTGGFGRRLAQQHAVDSFVPGSHTLTFAPSRRASPLAAAAVCCAGPPGATLLKQRASRMQLEHRAYLLRPKRSQATRAENGRELRTASVGTRTCSCSVSFCAGWAMQSSAFAASIAALTERDCCSPSLRLMVSRTSSSVLVPISSLDVLHVPSGRQAAELHGQA